MIEVFMKKYLDKVDLKKGSKEVQFSVRVTPSLKRRLGKLVDHLKKSDPKHKWNQNAALVAAIEALVESFDF